MKPTKKKPAKNKYVADYVEKKRDPVVSKLLDLKYRINEAYRNKGIDTKTDKSWVMKKIEDARVGGVISTDEMRVANNLWRKYEGK
jgi:hypothetical protein